MTAAHTALPVARSAGSVRPVCVACSRPYGRRRTPRGADPGLGCTEPLVEVPELVVCDQCWQLAGGTARVLDRLVASARDDRSPARNDGVAEDRSTPALVFAPAIDQLLAEADHHDLLHPIDRLLVSAGVRWRVLRHIAVPARAQLAADVLDRTPPPSTCSAESAALWLAAVDERIAAAAGVEFRYGCKRIRWRAIAGALSSCVDRDRRPLAWVTQAELAAAAGCTTRTVRRCVRWLREQGLLWELIPGCRLPQATVPDGETDVERAARLARLARAQATEEAAMARARAELHAIRRPPAATGQTTLPLDRPTRPGSVPSLADAAIADAALNDAALALELDPSGLLAELDVAPLVNLTPVYELRVPRLPAQQADQDQLQDLCVRQLSPGEALLTEHADAWVAPVNALCHPELVTVDHAGQRRRLPAHAALATLTSGNAIGLLRPTENVLPPQVSNNDLESSTAHTVDNGGASRRHNEGASSLIHSGAVAPASAETGVSAAHRSVRRQCRAVQVAQRLLNARLDPSLCDGVSVRWLAGLIRGSHLLDRHGWTDEDLVDLLHGHPEHAHLPRYIRNPRAWIRARFAQATPTLPPSKLRIVLEVERDSAWFREQSQLERKARAAAAITERRAAIAACPLCDQLGWLQLAHGVPTSRCTHDPATDGW